MSKKSANIDSWSDVVADSIRDAEVPVPESLWGSIESTLQSEEAIATPLRKGRVWRWVMGGVAAAVIAALFVWFDQDDIVDIVAPMETVAPIIADNLFDIQGEMPVEEFNSGVAVEASMLEVLRSVEESEGGGESNVESDVEWNTEPDGECEVLIDERSVDSGHKRRVRDLPSEPREYIAEKRARTTTLALLCSGGLVSQGDGTLTMTRQKMIYNAFASSGDGYAVLSFDDLYKSSEISHRQPIGIGLRLQRELSSRLVLSAGLNYTRLVSDIDMGSKGANMEQRIHFVGLPLRLNYYVASARDLHIYIGMGGDIEYCIGARVGDVTIDERPLHYSLAMSMGLEYDLSSRFALYVEPDLNYYLTDTKLESVRNNSPLSLSFRLGLSFKL